jgi:hypothetical protein
MSPITLNVATTTGLSAALALSVPAAKMVIKLIKPTTIKILVFNHCPP